MDTVNWMEWVAMETSLLCLRTVGLALRRHWAGLLSLTFSKRLGLSLGHIPKGVAQQAKVLSVQDWMLTQVPTGRSHRAGPGAEDKLVRACIRYGSPGRAGPAPGHSASRESSQVLSPSAAQQNWCQTQRGCGAALALAMFGHASAPAHTGKKWQMVK